MSVTRTHPDSIAPSTAEPGSEAPVRVESHGSVKRLILNRPQQFNALSTEMLTALQQAVDEVTEETRVVVIAAAGRAFCAGHDLKQMRAHPEREYHEALFQQCSRLMLSLIELSQPVIAEVQGLATAAGCQLVANADLAIASEEARFAVSGINAGLFCSTPAVPLSRNLARKRAFELLVTGDFIDAHQAVEWGLVNAAVPAEQLGTRVAQLCEAISAKSAVAIGLGKELFYRQLDLPLDQAYALAGERMACNMMAHDAGEGIDAFIEKRLPVWRHE